MTPTLWRTLMIACLAAIVAAGLDWGLPSRRNDASYLFATSPWTGGEIAAMAGERKAAAAADVDQDPVIAGDVPIVMNKDETERAKILRRYRLFSHQPDEMITFMALAAMDVANGDYDPHLYQYGGVWIYPVAGLLKACSQLGWIDLRSEKAFYYGDPEAFGRFYVVARAYSLFWYAVLLACSARVLHRLANDDFLPVVAIAVAGVLPVTFALAHEAKPHVAGAALTFAAALAAERWIRTGRWRDAASAGFFAGAAAGAVLTAAVALVILPLMAVLRRDTLSRRCGAGAAALAIAVAAYFAFNPYVAIHLIRRDAAVAVNVSNTQAMYAVGPIGPAILNAGVRLLDALTWPAAAVAVMAAIVIVARRKRPSPMAWLIAVPAAATLVPFILFAAGKPAEYARFALFPATAIGLMSLHAIALSISRPRLRMALVALLPVSIFIAGTLPYYRAFEADTGDADSRSIAAAVLESVHSPGATLQVYADPAPYCLPPIDFSSWRVALTRPGAPAIGAVIIRPIDNPARPAPLPNGYRREIVGSVDRPAPITWANKPFELLIRE